ncbi:LAFA_0F05556g1_1 [Lachancea sp. 'fantastica']|nr:LAFA_0F05556g1_1 [Lachancea sp. 'fantastica']
MTSSALRRLVALVFFLIVGTHLCEAAPLDESRGSLHHISRPHRPYYPVGRNETNPHSVTIIINANLTIDFPGFSLSKTEKIIEYVLEDPSQFITDAWNQYQNAKKSQDLVTGFENYLHLVSLQDSNGNLLEDVLTNLELYSKYVNPQVVGVVGKQMAKKESKLPGEQIFALVLNVLKEGREKLGWPF